MPTAAPPTLVRPVVKPGVRPGPVNVPGQGGGVGQEVAGIKRKRPHPAVPPPPPVQVQRPRPRPQVQASPVGGAVRAPMVNEGQVREQAQKQAIQRSMDRDRRY